MRQSDWFDDIPVLAKLPAEKAAEKLIEVGEEEAAALLINSSTEMLDQRAFSVGEWFGGEPPAWKHTAHTFGYVAPRSSPEEVIQVRHVSQIRADESLKNARLKITLDGLRVADYPGRGEHRILFDFYGQNQTSTGVEDLHFNATYRVREGERAAALGFPIFVGLNVGQNGVSFKCFTVNVKNTDDEAFLSLMDSDIFRQGLKLATIAQPAITPLTGLAVALTKSIATRNRNVPVQDFFLGLDFGSLATSVPLALGSYIAVQIPERWRVVWNWDDWVYQPSVGQIVSKADPEQLIPYNYIVFGVSRYEE